MPLVRRPLSSFLAVTAPAAGLVALHFTARPTDQPTPPAVRSDNDPASADALRRSTIKGDLATGVMDGTIAASEAVDQFATLGENTTTAPGLRARYGDRPADELAILSLLAHLEARREHPRAAEAIRRVRAEFERRFGSQEWVADQYGVSPRPIMRKPLLTTRPTT